MRLALLSMTIITLSTNVLSNDQLELVANEKEEKICMEIWKEQCDPYKKDQTKFVECTKTKINPSCKKILREMIKESNPEVKIQANESTIECNQHLKEKCPDKDYPSKIQQARCFQKNFSSLSNGCQKKLMEFIKKNKDKN